MSTVDFQLLNDAGIIFSVKDKSLLRSSLQTLKDENNCKHINYWGKITGVKADYYIIKSFGDYLGPFTYFYSTNLVDWAQVPKVDPLIEIQNRSNQTLFYGDPTFKTKYQQIEKPSTKYAASADALLEEDLALNYESAKSSTSKSTYFTEDKRLAVTLKWIDNVTNLVPYGYLTLSSSHIVVKNKAWQGLSQPLSLSLSSYLHQRFPTDPAVRENLEVKGTLSKPFDILDSALSDSPVGTWTIQYESIVSLVVVRSLMYRGYTLFLRPDTLQWGSLYNGDGLLNIDYPFVLPAVSKELSEPQLLNEILKEKEKREKEEAKKKQEEDEEKRRLAEEAEEEPQDDA